ncbi:MAG: methyltransferase domain-containing protein [Verrucomicrobiota bacterium]
MQLDKIKKHWENWSKTFETDLKATTKTSTIKKLEIDALYRAIKKTSLHKKKNVNVLEVGCGNGHNCFALSELLPNFHFCGMDYVPDMVKHAQAIQKRNAKRYSKITFCVGDALQLKNNTDIKKQYDIIFTDRCLINLNSEKLQFKAMDQLLKKLKPKGYLIILENFMQTYARQNDCRVAVGLPKRKPADYNLFFDENAMISRIKKSAKLLHIDDFGSLHDIALYVLVPMMNEGKTDYDHPLVQAATELSLSLSEKYESPFGAFGQNRLFLFQRRH